MTKKGDKELIPLFSDRGLARLYQQRQDARPTEGNRTRRALALTVAMVLVLFTALFSLIRVQRSEVEYLKSLSGVAIFASDALAWTVSRTSGCSTGCIEPLRAARPIATTRDLLSLDFMAVKADGIGDAPIRIATTIPPQLWRDSAPPAVDQPTVLSLPPIRYEQAQVYIDGVLNRTFFNGEALTPTLMIDPSLVAPLAVEIFIRPAQGQQVLVNGTAASYLVFIAQQSRYQKFSDLVAAKRSGAGKQLADIARIVLAVFSILLFIFVDSSPECLGLALFMGSKAIAVTFAQNWLPDAWTSSVFNNVVRNFLLCFGDILQLYFFVQLARVARPTLKPWFLIGGAVAAVYAFLVHMNFKTWDVDWNSHIWRTRNVVLGLCCMITALSAARYCLKHKLYSRAAALTIATSGTVVQIVYPIVALFPTVFQTDLFQSLYHAWEMHTPYVFAMATFINISSLENRVKSLSKELVSAKEIEREMALGRTVQQSFLHIPEIPPAMRVLCHHEAALYVSGDVFFVHWDESRDALTMVVTDVTGHGVQAALKASICSALAESIWNENQVRAADGPGARLAIYDQRLHSYLSKISRQEEICSIVGGEFDLKRMVCTFYRVNSVYPIVVRATADAETPWQVHVLPLKSRVATEVPLPRGGYVLFISDGFIDSSRTLADFSRFLMEKLALEGERLNEDSLKAHVLSYDNFARTNDDKTLLVFRCQDATARTLTDGRAA